MLGIRVLFLKLILFCVGTKLFNPLAAALIYLAIHIAKISRSKQTKLYS